MPKERSNKRVTDKKPRVVRRKLKKPFEEPEEEGLYEFPVDLTAEEIIGKACANIRNYEDWNELEKAEHVLLHLTFKEIGLNFKNLSWKVLYEKLNDHKWDDSIVTVLTRFMSSRDNILNVLNTNHLKKIQEGQLSPNEVFLTKLPKMMYSRLADLPSSWTTSEDSAIKCCLTGYGSTLTYDDQSND